MAASTSFPHIPSALLASCSSKPIDVSVSTAPGGGTVSFVSPWRHAYSPRVDAREVEGGGAARDRRSVGPAAEAELKRLDALGVQAVIDVRATDETSEEGHE